MFYSIRNCFLFTIAVFKFPKCTSEYLFKADVFNISKDF